MEFSKTQNLYLKFHLFLQKTPYWVNFWKLNIRNVWFSWHIE